MTTTEREPLTVPLRPCAPWCDKTWQEDGHADENPADRSCWSKLLRVPLSRNKPVRMSSGEWWFDHLDVVLRWPPREAEPVVVLNHEGGDDGTVRDASWEHELTLDEARALRDKLDHLLRVARG